MDIQSLKAKALAQLGTDVPTAQNLMRIAVSLAQEVNKATHLPGREKLDAVVRALRGLLAEKAVSDRVGPAELVILQNVVNDVIPETISLVVEASRGSFQLKKPTIGCVARVGALLCRQVAAYGPANVAAVAGQAAKVADKIAERSEKEVAEAKSDAIELVLRSVDATTDTTAPQEKPIDEPVVSQ